MRRRTSRWASVLLALVGVAAATAFVTVVPKDGDVDQPFEVQGKVGEEIDLGYATLMVTEVRLADVVQGTDGAVAGGVFVLVDAVWAADNRSVKVGGAELVDAEDRPHYATNRAGCADATVADPAYAQRITYCFDVDPGLVPDLQVKLGRGGEGQDGAFQRRDAVALVDLQLDGGTEPQGTVESPVPVKLPGPADEAATRPGAA